MVSGSEDYWDAKGGGLLNKLDGLDGTMDGRLTLEELNVSAVKTNLDSTLTKLDTTITKLTDQLTQLTSVQSNTQKVIHSGYNKVDTSVDTLVDLSSGSYVQPLFKAVAHPANTANIIFYLYKGAVLKQTFSIPPGGYRYYHEYTAGDMWNIVKVVAASGNQYYKYSLDTELD